jgi:hypothetical protein
MSRLTAEELALERKLAKEGWYQPSACEAILKISAKLDAVTRERDEARAALLAIEPLDQQLYAAGFEEAREAARKAVADALQVWGDTDAGTSTLDEHVDEAIRQLKPAGVEPAVIRIVLLLLLVSCTLPGDESDCEEVNRSMDEWTMRCGLEPRVHYDCGAHSSVTRAGSGTCGEALANWPCNATDGPPACQISWWDWPDIEL